ncbi:hypothetical protein ACJIZ3_025469 [Penstemon smallii]|uniref:BHLH domain-containing protein n=1 Tax=Penstemon smallii TaxID=265156 RepID=A0ABD3TWX7_9LAMI
MMIKIPTKIFRLGLGANYYFKDKFGGSIFQQQKKLENWEDQVLLNLSAAPAIISSCTSNSRFLRPAAAAAADVKQEELAAAGNSSDQSSCNYIVQNPDHDQEFYHHHHAAGTTNWPLVSASPTSLSITTTLSNNNNICNFSPEVLEGKKIHNHHHHHHSSECNSSGGVTKKKARVQQSSPQQPAALKVSKEKVRDRITTLHQIVSPFGKTDTASVLSESIGYIRFLQAQIEALSSPYMRHASEGTGHHQHSFLNHEIDMDGRGASKQDSLEGQGAKNLRSLGLCLVPISFTQLVGNDNAADYWAPPATLGGGF